MLGQSVGNYRVTQLLGEGGMGAVYLAEHPGIGRRVAVKVLLPQLARDQEMVIRFFNEARAANAVHHPGIVEVLDFGTLPTGAPYIVMEYLDGESLGSRLASAGRLALAGGVEIVAQAARALGAAHAQGIVHRDLKPDNLFLTPAPGMPGRERVKVLDFGIAKLSPRGLGVSTSVKTRTGVLMGTPKYMSPEQCRGTREVDHRSDIYSLGVILYEVLCGAPPFVTEGHGEMIHMHIAQAPAPPRSARAEISIGLERAVLRALAKEPDQRFQSMDELAAALEGRGGADAVEAAPGPGPARAVVSLSSQTTMVAPGEAVAATSGRTLLEEDAIPSTTLSDSASVIERPASTLRTRRRWRLPLALGASALAAAGVLVAIARGGVGFLEPAPAVAPEPADPTPPAAPAPTAAIVATTAPEPSVQSPARAAPRVSVSVRLASIPPGARVTRAEDGKVVGVTPLEETQPPRPGVEHLRLDREGYVTETVVLPLDRDFELSLPLKAQPAVDARKKKPREHAAPPRPRAPPGSREATPAKPDINPEPVPL